MSKTISCIVSLCDMQNGAPLGGGSGDVSPFEAINKINNLTFLFFFIVFTDIGISRGRNKLKKRRKEEI